MKTIKIFALILIAAFVCLFGYANVRRLSITEKLKQVNLVSFSLKGDISQAEKVQLEKNISAIAGITACSLNKEGDAASIIFYPEQVNEQRLSSLLSNKGKLKVSLKKLSVSGGCPIHQLSGSFHEFITALDIRN